MGNPTRPVAPPRCIVSIASFLCSDLACSNMVCKSAIFSTVLTLRIFSIIAKNDCWDRPECLQRTKAVVKKWLSWNHRWKVVPAEAFQRPPSAAPFNVSSNVGRRCFSSVLSNVRFPTFRHTGFHNSI